MTADEAAEPADAAPDPVEAAEGKRVGWGELFFDLVFVFAVTEVSALLATDHSWAGLLRGLIVFVPVYWLWVGAAIATNQQDADRAGFRLTLFAIGLAGLVMALALTDAYGHRGLLFAGAYWAGRLVLAANTSLRTHRVRANPPTVSVLLTGPLLVIGALLPTGPREAVWGVAAVIDLATPWLLQSRLRAMHIDPAHLAERFGLFVLIALGESVVAVGESVVGPQSLDLAQGVAVALAFVLVCGLWWVYFHFAADAIRHSLATARVQLLVIREVLSYGHLAFIAAIIALAVGVEEAVAHPGEQLDWATGGLLAGGCALYLGTFALTRWAMFRLVSVTRLSGAIGALLVLALVRVLPALAVVGVLAIILAGLNTYELIRVEHSGWRARLRLRS